MKSRNVVAVLALAVAAATMPAVSEARVSFDLSIAPPAPLVEGVPAPRPGYVWAPGYWTWQGERYNWIAGSWMKERPGYRWEPHRWVEHDSHWQLQHGHWQR
jgi:hypothetical protein